MLMREIELEAGLVVCERIRRQMAASRIEYDGKIIPVTISIGLALFKDGTPNSGDALLAAADAFLYAAKHGGRNRRLLPPQPHLMPEPRQLPPALRAGDRVHVVACSGRLYAGAPGAWAGPCCALLACSSALRAPSCSPERYLAGSDAARLAALEAALDDPACRCIWGGPGAAMAPRACCRL